MPSVKVRPYAVRDIPFLFIPDVVVVIDSENRTSRRPHP